jgi:hypothetical protein
MSEDGGPGRAVNRGESRPESEQLPPELTKVSPALTARSFPQATNDVLRCQFGPDGKQAPRPVFYQANDEHDPTERTTERGRERQLAEILETSPVDWHFAGLFSHPCKILATFPLQFP